jgi:hypothetical protein
MSYLNQNYFNNFQVRNPILKNPVNRNIPLQLTKVRPAVPDAQQTGANVHITVEDVSQACLKINPSTGGGVTYILPACDDMIDLLGVQSNGLPTPSYSSTVQAGDVLILPVINRSLTGAVIYAGTGGTGAMNISGATGVASVYGELNQLVVEFTNVSRGSLGVTGSYVLFGLASV